MIRVSTSFLCFSYNWLMYRNWYNIYPLFRVCSGLFCEGKNEAVYLPAALTVIGKFVDSPLFDRFGLRVFIALKFETLVSALSFSRYLEFLQ